MRSSSAIPCRFGGRPMAKRWMTGLLAICLLISCGYAYGQENAQGPAVERLEGEAYFPSESDWTYHFVYAYPHLVGEDYASLAVNDTYEMALDEMLQLVLPMFANEPDMLFDGQNEVQHDFVVTCNNGRYLSILQQRSQTMGEEGLNLSLEPLVFDMAGDYLGETLTLRGLVMVGDSSAQIAEAVGPVLYAEFCALQEQGVARADVDEEQFYLEFAATRDFYADAEGNAVFFFQPALLAEPSFDAPAFTFSPSELEALLAEPANE